MKRALFLMLLCYCPAMILLAQDDSLFANEKTIRLLEDAERKAILQGDTVQLSRLMSSAIVVQNPENTIVGYRQIINRIKEGKINYQRFERNIERISFNGNMAVVMGFEILVPTGQAKNSGKTVERRFTNVWIKEQEGWKLSFRQATIVSVKD